MRERAGASSNERERWTGALGGAEETGAACVVETGAGTIRGVPVTALTTSPSASSEDDAGSSSSSSPESSSSSQPRSESSSASALESTPYSGSPSSSSSRIVCAGSGRWELDARAAMEKVDSLKPELNTAQPERQHQRSRGEKTCTGGRRRSRRTVIKVFTPSREHLLGCKEPLLALAFLRSPMQIGPVSLRLDAKDHVRIVRVVKQGRVRRDERFRDEEVR